MHTGAGPGAEDIPDRVPVEQACYSHYLLFSSLKPGAN